MDLKENLLTTLSEESSEVGVAASKALRFGLGSMSRDHEDMANSMAIVQELEEMVAVKELLVSKGFLPLLSASKVQEIREKKKEKVLKYMRYSQKEGLLVVGDGDLDNLGRELSFVG